MVVAVAGSVFALAANQVSPRGLSLTRNYFPGGKPGAVAPLASNTNIANGTPSGSNSVGSTSGGSTNDFAIPSDAELLAARLRANGLHLIPLAKVRELDEDPRLKQGLVLIIDARSPAAFSAGHIPGALEFDPYHPEQYAATIMPLCQGAEEIVVYCTGGECEDSEFAAISLRDAGIPVGKLFVFGGGIGEWKENKLPVETGLPAAANPKP